MPSIWIKRRKIIFMAIILILILFSVFLYSRFFKGKARICFQDNYCILADIRDTFESREIGLMFRNSLDENQGMLFVFDGLDNSPFWMKNMNFPIDIIFISPSKQIVSISENAIPCINKPDNECELYYSNGDYLYVIETVSGFSKKYNLTVGQDVYFNK